MDVIAGAFSLLRRGFQGIVQSTCGLGGHNTLIQFKDRRMSLRCQRCGHESPGWSVKTPSETEAGAQAADRPRGGMVAEHRV
jgi:hypothetical protein